MLPVSVGRLPPPHTTMVSVPGFLVAALLTWTAAAKVWPASVDRRKTMLSVSRRAQVTLTPPSEPTWTLHPNGLVPLAPMTCSFV